MPKFTIAIPSYEFGGKGGELIDQTLEDLTYQTFEDFEVVVSDHSPDDFDDVKNSCEKWSDDLDIRYFRNKENRGNAASNFNFVVNKSSGEYIKFLCQDDSLYGSSVLWSTMNALKETKANWLASAYWHADSNRELLLNVHYPKMNDRIYVVNTIGTPSGVTIKNFGKEIPEFDTNLSYCFDCDFYYRFYKKFGSPVILNIPTVVNLIWENSITSGVSQELINKESEYIIKKYGIIN
jgi:glycosyltransferase involved in cell wall biosynthesis